MADPPNHFFKFIPPDFKFNLSIPKSFLTKLDGWRGKKAILRRGRHKWAVSIGDEGVFGDGWRKFVMENGVEEFDIIVFKHQGNMVFDIIVFDPSACERQYPNNLHDKVRVSLTESDSLHTQERSKIPKKRKRTDHSSQSKDKRLRLDEDSCFVTIMTPYNITSSRLSVPLKFARSNRLTTKKSHTQIVLVDEAKRTCRAKLHVKTDQIRLRGWRKLMRQNNLKVGDACMFKLVEDAKLPVFNFYNLGKKNTNDHVQVKKESGSTIKIKKDDPFKSGQSSLFYFNYEAFLQKCLPVEFSKSNDLKVGEMILRDDKGRSWKIQLKEKAGTYLNFGCGFRDFWDANGLKVGDEYKFVLVEKEKGKSPIMNVSYIGKKPTNNDMQVKKETISTIETSSSSTRYFISTMKQYSFKRPRLYLPAEFSIPNDLRTGEMILRDDKGISWKVQLKKIGKERFYLGCGFRDFMDANGLIEGDAYKFELVVNEKDKTPIVNFSLHVDSVPSRKEDTSHYIGKVKSYYMYLPSEFVWRNGLLNKEEMILKNDDERSWTMDIKRDRNYCYIGREWKEFCAANGLKEGDLIKLELVINGKIPVVSFTLKKIH